MGRRRRSSGVPAPRKRRPKQETFQAQFFSEDDIELAQAVCQVVKDLVSQVADEPYGDLTRKRPNLFNVLRKFIKDSMQAFQDAAAAEYLSRTFKRTRFEVEEELPYGMDLVWGVILSEMEKADKKEKARLYSAQKAARIREKKKLEAEQEWEQKLQEAQQFELRKQAFLLELELTRQAAIEAQRPKLPGYTMMNDKSASSEEEIHREKKMNNKYKPFVVHADPMPIANMSPSPRSDDSDWAVTSRPTRKNQADSPFPGAETLPKYTLVPIGPDLMYPVLSSALSQGRGRGRGRPRGGRTPTVRSVLDAAMGGMPSQVKSELHPNVSLLAPGQSKRVEPQFDFLDQKSMWDEKYIIKDSLPPRPPRGRGSRGGIRGLTKREKNLQLIAAAWDVDAEEQYQQHLMAESIESSGESASQESNNDIMNTINEVVTRVNNMIELDGTTKRKRTVVEGKDGKKVQNVRGSRTEDVNEPCTSTGAKRRKINHLITIDSESDEMEDEDPSLGPTSPIRHSSIPPNQISNKSNSNSSASSSDIFIIE